MATPAASDALSDGPVLTLITKRLRALKKKYNRILQMEDRVATGQPLNSEQQDLLRSKTAVSAQIEELDHLRQPLSLALHQELQQIQTPKPTPNSSVEDLVKLLYFGTLFDVKPQSEYETVMLTRAHERGCCLTYDAITDETREFLVERDLDMIAALGGMVVARPASSGVSHRSALEGCVEHARRWLGKSEEPVQLGSDWTYASLRERLDKILASGFCTATPEVKPSVDLAAEVGIYGARDVQVGDFVVTESVPEQEDSSGDQYQYQGDDSENSHNESGYNLPTPADEVGNADYSEASNSVEVASTQQELDKLQVGEEEHTQRDGEPMEAHYVPRRAYQNYRGGNRNGGARRGYSNGRGGRGGRGGGYQNGRGGGQYYEQGYYPKNYHNGRGRGGRSGSPPTYNNHGAAAHGGRGPGVEMGAS